MAYYLQTNKENNSRIIFAVSINYCANPVKPQTYFRKKHFQRVYWTFRITHFRGFVFSHTNCVLGLVKKWCYFHLCDLPKPYQSTSIRVNGMNNRTNEACNITIWQFYTDFIAYEFTTLSSKRVSYPGTGTPWCTLKY